MAFTLRRGLPRLVTAAATAPVPLAARPMSSAIYARFPIYGDQAAVTFRPTPARFVEAGASGYSLKSSGWILAEFAARNPTGSTYDWKNKKSFGLSVAEIGRFALAPHGDALRFSHTTRGTDEVKVLQFVGGDQGGIRIEYSERDGAPIFSVPATSAQYFVLKQLMFHSLPTLAGWQQALDPSTFDERTMLERGTGAGDDPHM